MKKTLIFVLIVTFIIVLAGCGSKKSQEDIFNLVEKNYDEIVTACENNDKESLLTIDGISKVKIVDGYVLFYCKGEGIAPSSQDYGFYYTENNIPVGVDCNLDIACYRDTMQPKGSGYEGTVDYNTFYTEHIKGNFYFYSNAY